MSAMVNGEGNFSDGSDTDDVSRPPRMVFLALIMLVSSVVNVLLLYAVFQSRKIRRSIQNITIMNLAAVCLADCFLNMSLVMGSLAAGAGWNFGEALCKWHAFVMNLVLVETVLLLTVLACDRFLAVRFVQKYDSFISSIRLIFVIAFTWILALAFSIPFFFNVVEMTFRPKLHTCSVSHETSLAFICLASVLCFLAPTVIIIIMFSLIFRQNYKQQHEVKTIITQNNYSDQLMDESRLWQEMLTVKYVGMLCLLWFILEIPFVITSYIQQYRFSSELSFSVDYPWGVDVAFIWMRFSFSAVFPCATFVWKKDLWQCCKECVICHRSNSVLDIQVKVNGSKLVSVKELPHTVPPKSKDREQTRLEPPNLLSFNVPVLFATSDGIHIETPHSDVSDAEYTDVDSREPTVKGRQLDIDDTNNNAQLTHDTSDYDSSTEAGFSFSQPLSAHHIRSALETNSLPDLRAEGQNERGAPSDIGDLASTQGMDSGIGLSETAGSSRRKGIQMLAKNSQQSEQKDSQDPVNAHIIQDSFITKEQTVQNGIQRANASCDTDTAFERTNGGKQHGIGNDDNAGCSAAETQHYVPATLPKTHGRLKPLQPGKKPKTKKHGAARKKTVGSLDCTQNRDASRTETETRQKETASLGVTKAGDTAKSSDMKSSKDGQGRGHKRTVTSDSEKALLGSNSSVEMQDLKTQSSNTTSANGLQNSSLP